MKCPSDDDHNTSDCALQ